MVTDNYETDKKVRSAQASITTVSVFVALSVATLGFVVSQTPVQFTYNAVAASASALILAVVLFLIALDFFVLCIYHCEHIDSFGLMGSCLYSLGTICMVVGISLSLMTFGTRALSFMFLSVATCGYLAYYIVRMWKLRKESSFGIRILFRVLFWLLAATGYVLIATVGG